MDSETLRDRHRVVLRRWQRVIADDDVIPEMLLAELAAVADEHARSARGTTTTGAPSRAADGIGNSDSIVIADGTPARAAPRRRKPS